MKNITYRGFSPFIKALRKHVLAGTYANFWTEVHSRKHALVHSKFKLAGETQTIVYMNQLVDKMIEVMPDITEQEMLDVINQVLRISFMFKQKYWFMISVNEAKQDVDFIKPLEDGVDKTSVATDATIEAVEATDVLSPEDNGVQDDLDSLELIVEDVAQESATETLVDVSPTEDIQSDRAKELKALTVKELREILKARDVKFAFASKEAKLIELILSSD